MYGYTITPRFWVPICVRFIQDTHDLVLDFKKDNTINYDQASRARIVVNHLTRVFDLPIQVTNGRNTHTHTHNTPHTR